MELKDIALDRNEFPIVRIAAIEAFRNVISQRAYSVLLTMFQDITEQPNIRMMSFSVLINSLRIPPKHIADLVPYIIVILFNCITLFTYSKHYECIEKSFRLPKQWFMSHLSK